MKYVLDSSVAFKWEVPETDSDKATLLRDDFRNGIHELVAPDFFPLELAHALTRAERQGRIAVGQATLFWSDAMTTAAAAASVPRSRQPRDRHFLPIANRRLRLLVRLSRRTRKMRFCHRR
jgi:hypothetical protein